MAGSSEQVWLTYALSDASVKDALTLSFSLRNVLTSRKIGVIISYKVSVSLREALEYGFDYVFYLDEERNTAGLKSEEFVKLFALTLKSFERCVMLSPKMLVMSNCDELFDNGNDEEEKENENSQPLIWSETGDMSILLLNPSLHLFKEVMKGIRYEGNGELQAYLKKWLRNQNPKSKFLDRKYNRSLCASSGMLLQSENDISIVNLNNIPNNVDKLKGYVEKRIMEVSMNIRNEKVEPLLKALLNDSTSLEMLEG
ncbi:unnamed protein product, partial [Orchesella dallaii]